MSASSVLSARNLTKSYGGRRVLDDVAVVASAGQRIGLVGENGAGKSTLLRLLAGIEEPDAGLVQRPRACGFLHQTLPFPPEATLQDIVDDAVSEVLAAKARLEELAEAMQERPDDAELLAEYGTLLEAAEAGGLWDVERRIELVLAGLGLGPVEPARPIASLSGGQRNRLALAALLIRQPEAMLLDEPTNHLDDAAIAFVEEFLGTLPGAVIIASHDRAFLDEVCTDILDLDPSRQGVTRYGGAYSDYLELKRLERIRWEEQFADEQKELQALRRSVDVTARSINHARPLKDNNKLAYNGAGGRVQRQIARRVRNARNKLDDLKQSQVGKPPEILRFSATMTDEAGRDQAGIVLRDVRVAGRLAVDRLIIGPTTRLLITGPNGAGKSTLLKLLAGQLEPDDGEIQRSSGLRIGLLDQEITFENARLSPRQIYEREAGGDAGAIARFGLLAPRDLDRPIGDLSIGQQRRLALALLIARPPDIVLLDEPTNHLSLPLMEELEGALATTPGGVVIASHDRWLRRGWTGETISIEEGKIRP